MLLLFSPDSREPSSLVKPLKSSASTTQENDHNVKLEAAKSKSVRHLILIRHGQYNLKGASDSERYLTEVGRKQASFTGDRLKQLNIPLDVMVRSTMTRAQETGKIISTHVANIPIENCSLIEEGAPIAPQPPIGHWHPEPSVSGIKWSDVRISIYTCFWIDLSLSPLCSSFSKTVLASRPVFASTFIGQAHNRSWTRTRWWCAMLMSSGIMCAEHCNCHQRHGCAFPSTTHRSHGWAFIPVDVLRCDCSVILDTFRQSLWHRDRERVQRRPLWFSPIAFFQSNFFFITINCSIMLEEHN